MKHALAILVGLTTLAAVGSAQQRPTPQRAGQQPERLQGVPEMEYIVGRLNLDEQQATHASGLIDEYQANITTNMNLGALTDLLSEFQRAKAANDEARMAQLAKEIQDNQPAVVARNEFLDNLRQILNDEQKTRLEQVLTFLKAHPTGDVTLIGVFKIAIGLDVTAAQRVELDAVHRQFRRQHVAGKRNAAEIVASDIPAKFAAALREKLTPAQQQQFDAAVGELRPGER